MARTIAEKIANREERIQQLLNEKKQLIQKQKAEARRARNHRLYTRGGMLESLAAELETMTDDEVKVFLKKTIGSSFARKVLAEMRGEGG